jgi:DNA-binding XRE family transcriptional regulator
MLKLGAKMSQIYVGQNTEMHRRRKERRLSFKRLGEIAGVNEWTVYVLERGFTKHTRLDRKWAVANVLGICDVEGFCELFPEERSRVLIVPAPTKDPSL